jgi:hypothetical protein
MNIPKNCEAWRQLMAEGGDEHLVLGNIERDQCVPPDVANDFFEALASTAPWADSKSAWDAAKSVVYSSPDRFFCQGRPVPDGKMTSLLRFRFVRDWNRELREVDPERAERLSAKYGIPSDNRWPKDLDDRQRAEFCSELKTSYPTGNLKGISWVADEKAVQDSAIGSLETLRRLGLPHFEKQDWAFVLRYNRAGEAKEIHVPRALDGIDSGSFDVVKNCDAPYGMTKPTAKASPGASGYPEAVHRSARIDLDRMEIRQLNGDS